MIFKNKQRIISNESIPQLKINNVKLDRVYEYRYLGVYLDDSLSWSNHVNYTANKISKTNGMLKRLSYLLPKHILTTLYNSLINPYLHYCILTWGTNTERLLTLQKRAIRIISNSHFLAHTENLFREYKILKIEDIYKQHQLVFYHKFLHNTLPNSISQILTTQNSHVRSCHASFFLKPAARVNTESAKSCIRHTIPTLINNYDKTFIESFNSISIPNLKKLFKLRTLENYHFNCTDQNCYPCISRFFNPYGFSSRLKFLHIFYYMINFIYHRPFTTSGLTSYLNIFDYL